MSEREKSSLFIGIDVETLPSTDSFSFEFTKPFPEMRDVPDNKRLVDPIKISDWKCEKLTSMRDDWKKEKEKAEKEAYDEWHKEGLISYRGRIFCLSYGRVNANKKIKTVDFLNGEKEMLQEFYNDIKGYSVVQFLGTNLNFDLLWLYHRALHFGLYDLASIVRKDSGYTKTRDVELMDLAGGGIEWKYRISLDNICKLLGVKSPKDEGINGSEVLDFYLKGEYQKIREYNERDVAQLIECYLILK